jgi:ABC-type uncharacterized transport system ATPase subunit
MSSRKNILTVTLSLVALIAMSACGGRGTPSPYVPTSKLSGGNQQKVIVARELSHPIKLLIANQPTRGLDVGSIEYIHHEIVEMRDRGHRGLAGLG